MKIQTVWQRFRSVRCFVREIFKEVFCMETPCLCPSEGHRYGDWKLTKTYVIEFCYKKPVVVFWGLINIYMSTYSHFFNLRNGILGRNFNIVSRKRLEIQPCFITRGQTLSNWKDKSSPVLMTNKTKISKGLIIPCFLILMASRENQE